MNHKLMLRMLGRTLQVEALCLLLPLFVALGYGEDPRPFLCIIPLLLVPGSLLARLRARAEFFSREGFAVVGLIWFALILCGALPFWFSGQFGGYIDCLFETASGFTTTGATILTDIEVMPRGLLFWRAFSSWIGGMGVLLFTLAFLPKVGGREQVLVFAESPGPISSKLVPRTARSSQILYAIYGVLTGVEIVLLRLFGLPWFDSVTTAFATISTGGFAVRDVSIAAYASPAIEVVVIVFMLLGSLNFAAYFLLLTGQGRRVLQSDELRFFLGAVVVASAAVAVTIAPEYDGAVGRAVRDAVFQVVTVISTTGFSTADFARWPQLAQAVLVLLMFLGGCSGSTTGSMKCARIMLLLRWAKRTLLRFVHPRAVTTVRLDGKPVEDEVLDTVAVYFLCFFLVLGAGCLILTADGGTSLVTSFTGTLTCLANVGPGLEDVGPMGNFGGLSALSKLTLSLAMLIGRLEIFPILVLLCPALWKRD